MHAIGDCVMHNVFNVMIFSTGYYNRFWVCNSVVQRFHSYLNIYLFSQKKEVSKTCFNLLFPFPWE